MLVMDGENETHSKVSGMSWPGISEHGASGVQSPSPVARRVGLVDKRPRHMAPFIPPTCDSQEQVSPRKETYHNIPSSNASHSPTPQTDDH
jgi:hypothetical protein